MPSTLQKNPYLSLYYNIISFSFFFKQKTWLKTDCPKIIQLFTRFNQKNPTHTIQTLKPDPSKPKRCRFELLNILFSKIFNHRVCLSPNLPLATLSIAKSEIETLEYPSSFFLVHSPSNSKIHLRSSLFVCVSTISLSLLSETLKSRPLRFFFLLCRNRSSIFVPCGK